MNTSLRASHARFALRPLVRAVYATLLAGAAQGTALAQEANTNSAAQLSTVTVTGVAAPGVTEHTQSYTTEAMATATGLPLSIRETPQSVSVVTRQRIEDQGLRTTGDVLDAAPGISSTRNDANRLSFSARGFSIDNYQFDGLTLPVLSPWAFGESNLDTAIYDRVEVVRGATGLMTGAGNPSAAINFVRKQPLREFAASGQLSVGSWNYKRLEADVSTPLTESGNVRARMVAAYSDVGSHMALLDTHNKTLYGVVSADLGPNTDFSGGLIYQRSVNDGFGSGFPLFYTDGTRTNFDRSASNNAGWAKADTETRTVFLDLNHRLENRWNARFAYSHSETDMFMRHLYRSGFVDRQTGAMTNRASAPLYDGDLSRDALHATLSGPVGLFGRQHELSFGWMSVDDDLDLPSYPALSTPVIGSYFNWRADQVAAPGWSDTPTQGDTTRNRQTGTYAVGRFSLADPLHLIVGARVSNWKTSQNYFGTSREYRYRNEVTPYAGLVYDIDRQHTAYASYTEIFKPQNARTPDGDILDPITGKSYELGIKGSYLDNRINASAAIFQTRQNNLAEALPGVQVVNVPGSQAFRAVSGAKVEGFDLEVGGELARGWNVAASYTSFTAKDALGAPINTSHPRSLVKLYTTYRMPGALENLTVGGGVRWQSRMYQTVTAPANQRVRVEQSAYALVDLMARYQFTPKVSASLNLNNVFDKKYYSQIGMYTQGWYGAPRNVMLNLRMQY
ncbi:TonB-dependent siderophore receptor [Pigmentiphaga aceris]|uniref:TonB-dependent siderophore receptor n=1 Tax=Pigmentiphaga aceris TaxID=1940612 RepID=A0A5C0B4S8_9BURK|nr:TonB-dependent siderophore receptor [Pigmentiphaga aceris]QEI08280.1 TonB-dependent siderophore receptor [Pigmentiphaga aceris]